MSLSRRQVEQLQIGIDQSLKLMAEQDAGMVHSDPDQPNTMFLVALNDLVRNPVSNQTHLDMLHKAIGFLMAEEPNPYTGTLDEAIDDAFEDAIKNAGPLQQALLAVARHRLKQPPLNA